AGGGVDVDEGAGQADDVDRVRRCGACGFFLRVLRLPRGSARHYRIHASSSVRVSVRESRYFTITGVASDRPHSVPLPAVTARAPGTTTAPSGTTSGRPAGGRMS